MGFFFFSPSPSPFPPLPLPLPPPTVCSENLKDVPLMCIQPPARSSLIYCASPLARQPARLLLLRCLWTACSLRRFRERRSSSGVKALVARLFAIIPRTRGFRDGDVGNGSAVFAVHLTLAHPACSANILRCAILRNQHCVICVV